MKNLILIFFKKIKNKKIKILNIYIKKKSFHILLYSFLFNDFKIVANILYSTNYLLDLLFSLYLYIY